MEAPAVGFRDTALVFYFLPFSPNIMAADITRYLTYYLPPISDNFILAPKLINPAYNKAVEVEEFKLYNKYYI